MAPEFDWRTIEGFGEHDFEKFYEQIVSAAPANSVLVEIGCYYGRSLVHLGQLARREDKGLHIVGIDIHGRDVRANLEKAGLTDIVMFMQGSSLEVVKSFKDKSCFFIFLDDSHEREHVAAEIDAWIPKLADNGILAGHDYRWHLVCEPVNAKLDGVKHCPDYDNVWWAYKQVPRDNSDIYKPTTIPQTPRTK